MEYSSSMPVTDDPDKISWLCSCSIIVPGPLRMWEAEVWLLMCSMNEVSVPNIFNELSVPSTQVSLLEGPPRPTLQEDPRLRDQREWWFLRPSQLTVHSHACLGHLLAVLPFCFCFTDCCAFCSQVSPAPAFSADHRARTTALAWREMTKLCSEHIILKWIQAACLPKSVFLSYTHE